MNTDYLNRKIGLLTIRGYPLLPYFIRALENVGLTSLVLIFDQKEFSEKDRLIFLDRTQNRFPTLDLNPYLEKYPHYDVPNHSGEECISLVRQHEIPLLLNTGTPRMLKEGILNAPLFGVMNTHPGILPKYRGACCCEWAIYRDEPVGVTAHFMDTGLDTGPIVLTRELPVKKFQTYPEVRSALYSLVLDTCAAAAARILQEGLKASDLPPQEDGIRHKPISDDLLLVVKGKLASGVYPPES